MITHVTCIIVCFHATFGTIFAVFAYYKRYIYWNMLKTNWKIVHNKYTSEWYTNVVVAVAFLGKVLNNYKISWNPEPTIQSEISGEML